MKSVRVVEIEEIALNAGPTSRGYLVEGPIRDQVENETSMRTVLAL
jgi:hypothetical protein